MQHPIIHIVRRFGRVGGMETYVWNIVHGLLAEGQLITVICEEVFEQPARGIQILKVDESIARRRWKSMMLFRHKVDCKIREQFAGQPVLVHSHERSLSHQVSTFHGPPISITGHEWCSRFSRRVNAWRDMEREELLGKNVRVVLSVSSQIQSDLCVQYPKINNKILDLAWPGIYLNKQSDDTKGIRLNGEIKFLFVGKEWKRKGLDIAIRIIQQYRKQKPGATLTVFGVEHKELPRSMKGLSWVTVNGWDARIPWDQFDLLIHPARKEPFGMVVAEARSFGLPVLISSKVGATDLNFNHAAVIDIDAPLSVWVDAIAGLVRRGAKIKEVKWSWNDLVKKHIDIIYPQVDLWTP